MLLILVPADVVAELGGLGQLEGLAGTLSLVQRPQLALDQRHGGPVRDRVVHLEHQPVLRLSEAQQRDGEQRAVDQVQGSLALGMQPPAGC